MAEHELMSVDGLELVLIRSKRKSLTLEVSPEGLKARSPLRMRRSGIEQFVRQKRAWIDKQLAQTPVPLAPLLIEDGAELLFAGISRRLSLEVGRRGQGSVDQTSLRLPVSRSHLPLHTSAHNKLIAFYKRQALQTIERRVDWFAVQMHVPKHKLKGVKVRDYKRRWGSCDQLGRLSFNWRIMQAPPEVIDYVVVHELAHCHEFNHSPRFWALVEQQLPDWRSQQAWLQHNGGLLYRF